MKKSITLTLFLCLFTFVKAQTISGFENISLGSESYRDGKDSADKGGFTSGKIYFPNTYDTSFGGFWSNGFAISNLTSVATDSITLDFTKEFNAVVPGGADSTTHYAIAQCDALGLKNPVIHLTDTNESMLAGCYVTNSNYTYLSMKWGDMIGRKFGDSDFFELNIIGFLGGKANDTITFKLADGKSLVTAWTWIDLTRLGYVDSVMFTLTSSDVGQWGMNTPAFFCIDQVKTISGMNGLNNHLPKVSVNMYPNPANNWIQVSSQSQVQEILLADLSGKIIGQTESSKMNIANLSPGMYVLNVTTSNGNATLKFIKE